MFQKKITDKYLSKIDKVLLDEKYNQFNQIFGDKQKQENIRASKEEQYQEGFIRDLFCAVYKENGKTKVRYRKTGMMMN